MVFDIKRIATSRTKILARVISKVHRTLPSEEVSFWLSVVHSSHSMGCNGRAIHLAWGGSAWRIHRHKAQGSGRHQVIRFVDVHCLRRVLQQIPVCTHLKDIWGVHLSGSLGGTCSHKSHLKTLEVYFWRFSPGECRIKAFRVDELTLLVQQTFALTLILSSTSERLLRSFRI